MLVRLWRKGNPSALLVGMQTGAATVENYGISSKNQKWNCLLIPLLVLYPKNPELAIQKNLGIPMFIAALFTIAKCWKQPKCPSVSEWIKNYGTFTQWNTMQQKKKKEGIPPFCDSMNGSGHYYAK